jgi:short-subunit dehydrogenase
MEHIRQTMEVNYFGMVQVTKAFLPFLRLRKGRIVNNSSIAGGFSVPFLSVYSSSKHAVEAFSNALRRELYPQGVRVSILRPGFVQSEIIKNYKDCISSFEVGSLYHEEERTVCKTAFWLMRQASSPKVTSDAVVHAMRAQNPNILYTVGAFSSIAFILSLLPSALLDILLRIQLPGM